MGYYIRKISGAKWPKDVNGVTVNEVSADAITGCLRTTANELSLWKVDNIGNPEEDVLPLITTKIGQVCSLINNFHKTNGFMKYF